MAFDRYGFDAGKNKSQMGDTTALQNRIAALEQQMQKINKGGTGAPCPIPIGGLYISVSTTNPASIWPNTSWTALPGGRAIIQYAPGNSQTNQLNAETYNKYHNVYGGNNIGVQQYDLSKPQTQVGSWNTSFKLSVGSLPGHAHPFTISALRHTHDISVDQNTFFHPEIPGNANGFPTPGMTANHRVYAETSIPSTGWDCRDYDKTVVYYTMRVDMDGWKTGQEPFGAGINDDGVIRASTFDKTKGGQMQAPMTTAEPNLLAANGSYIRVNEESDAWSDADTRQMASSMYAAQGSEQKNDVVVANNVQPSFVVCMWHRVS